MRGWFHFDFGDLRRSQPAHVQGIREKAADGIRTHDLLHGKRPTLQPFSQYRAKKLTLHPRAIGRRQARFGSVWAARLARCPNNRRSD